MHCRECRPGPRPALSSPRHRHQPPLHQQHHRSQCQLCAPGFIGTPLHNCSHPAPDSFPPADITTTEARPPCSPPVTPDLRHSERRPGSLSSSNTSTALIPPHHPGPADSLSSPTDNTTAALTE
ncbi:multiple epidermal growth factor-like domains protein 9 isoform X1 [Lates japonicus]|uniref:Multiple epidermal growth factor-like domains protein 9 isoform X1 n=1 Tax=Lates japonicus TaxID=270547 RepID=A0AAD3MF90_LATJO|nr:multiple epidermal growth factor-like domains protein 9 isoform X1 [Lates japonicus]